MGLDDLGDFLAVRLGRRGQDQQSWRGFERAAVALALDIEPFGFEHAGKPCVAIEPLPADVRRLPEVEVAVGQALERWGRIDALVNNAGVARYVPLVEMTAEEFQWQLDVNLTGLFNGCKAVLPHLLERARSTDERPAGQILNIGSILGTVGRAGGTAYCATKWGLMGFTESLRLEVQKEGIRVMALCPGQVQTDFAGIAAETKAKALQAGTVALQALQMLAAPPDGQPGTVLLRPFYQA